MAMGWPKKLRETGVWNNIVVLFVDENGCKSNEEKVFQDEGKEDSYIGGGT